MKLGKKLAIVGVGYLLVGVGRGLYVAHKYPGESAQRDAAWWAGAAFLWPYYVVASDPPALSAAQQANLDAILKLNARGG